MKTIISAIIFLISSTCIISQSLQLKYSHSGNGFYLGDIDKDGHAEILDFGHTNVDSSGSDITVSDITTGNVKWTFSYGPGVYLELCGDFSLFQDYNSNNIRDIVLVSEKNSQFQREMIVIDPSTKEVLFTITTYLQSTNEVASQLSSTFLADVDGDGKQELVVYKIGVIDIYSTEIKTVSSMNSFGSLPNKFQLKQNYPNPFNPTTVIEYSLDKSGNSKIELFDSIGRLIRTIDDGYKNAGNYKISFDGKNGSGSKLSSGVYYYRLVNNGNAQTKKMLLLK